MVLVVRMIFEVLSFIIIVDALVSFILPPYHAVRNFLDRVVEPMLSPIRKILPSLGGFDFSPVVLLLLIQLVEYLVLRLIS